jgi:GntR family histidine utilization transcriptional repressor
MPPTTAPLSNVPTPFEPAAAVPLYLGVKQMILARISAGDWLPGSRVPSENELVAELGLSRMTINRALRELANDGVVTRVQGLGSFVAAGKVETSVFEVRNIADEIAERGHAHSAKVLALDAVRATPDLSDSLRVEIGAAVFHSLILHTETDIPMQLEDRYVNAATAPDYLAQDFTQVTPNRYLSMVIPWTEAEHEIEAVLPGASEARLLAISRADPCLAVRRTTYAGDRVVSTVRLLMPGGRYRVRSRQKAG